MNAIVLNSKLKLDLASMRVVRQHETSGKSEELAAKDVNNVDRAEHRAHGTLEVSFDPKRSAGGINLNER